MSNQKYPNTQSVSATGVAIKKRRDHYSHAKADARLEKKRQEADARQVVYDDLTIPQRIERAKARRGNSKREIARLEKKLVKKSAKVVTTTNKE